MFFLTVRFGTSISTFSIFLFLLKKAIHYDSCATPLDTLHLVLKILKIDVEYPKELQKNHNELPVLSCLPSFTIWSTFPGIKSSSISLAKPWRDFGSLPTIKGCLHPNIENTCSSHRGFIGLSYTYCWSWHTSNISSMSITLSSSVLNSMKLGHNLYALFLAHTIFKLSNKVFHHNPSNV